MFMCVTCAAFQVLWVISVSYSHQLTICKQISFKSNNELNEITQECIKQTVIIHETKKENGNPESMSNADIQAVNKNLISQAASIKNLENAVFAILTNNPELCYAGIKSRRIPNSAMTASSHRNNGYYAYDGRLDNTAVNPNPAWHAAEGLANGSWLQVDFQSKTHVVGVITQGRYNADQWITSFKILYGNFLNNLTSITSGRNDVIFQGNQDRSSRVTNYFPRPITARYFRLVVVTYKQWACLRLEYLLC